MSHAHGQIYLFTIFGTRALSLEATRPVHNRVAGAPEDVAAAKSLSDLSHMVYTSVDEQSAAFVIMDLWTNLSGFNQFFSEPKRAEKQAAAGMFTQNEPVVWEPAEGFFTYHIPVPTGHNNRFFALLRGPVVSREQARTLVNQVRIVTSTRPGPPGICPMRCTSDSLNQERPPPSNSCQSMAGSILRA
jgi:hypothetical protein